MSTGAVWRRPDGLRWAEVQAPTVEPSGWRLMVPLVDLADAADAPPLVVTLGRTRARVHLLTSVHVHDLGTLDDHLAADAVDALQAAVRSLVDGHDVVGAPGGSAKGRSPGSRTSMP